MLLPSVVHGECRCVASTPLTGSGRRSSLFFANNAEASQPIHLEVADTSICFELAPRSSLACTRWFDGMTAGGSSTLTLLNCPALQGLQHQRSLPNHDLDNPEGGWDPTIKSYHAALVLFDGATRQRDIFAPGARAAFTRSMVPCIRITVSGKAHHMMRLSRVTNQETLGTSQLLASE